MNDHIKLLKEILEKTNKSVNILGESVANLKPFEPSKNYNAKELEPYDALTSRFERAIEILLSKCFRAYDIYVDGVSEGTIRDILNRMAKRGIISKTVDEWLDIRGLRNKIAHDYLPEQLSQMYEIIENFYPEIKNALENINKQINRDSN